MAQVIVLTDARERFKQVHEAASGRLLRAVVSEEEQQQQQRGSPTPVPLDTLRVTTDALGKVLRVHDAWLNPVSYVTAPLGQDHPPIGSLSESGSESVGGATTPVYRPLFKGNRTAQGLNCHFCGNEVTPRASPAHGGQWVVPRCAQCQRAVYCNAACAQSDWQMSHQYECAQWRT